MQAFGLQQAEVHPHRLCGLESQIEIHEARQESMALRLQDLIFVQVTLLDPLALEITNRGTFQMARDKQGEALGYGAYLPWPRRLGRPVGSRFR